jgi:hypothetical protein
VTLYIKATQGTRFVDPGFDRAMQEADRQGRELVPCHLVSAEPAELQAAHFIRFAALRPGVQVALSRTDPYGLGHRAPEGVVKEMIATLTLLTGKPPIVLEE